MIVRTSPRNRPGAQAGGSLSAHLGDARRAAGPCLAAPALIGTLAACGEDQTGNRGSDVDPLAEPAGEIAIRVADCNGTGTVTPPASGKEFITVLSGPSITSLPKVRLMAGMEMHLCTPAKNERWVGVIFGTDGELPDLEWCQITTDGIPRYKAPCSSGWVSAGDVESGRISARYDGREEAKAADREAAISPRDDIGAIDRLSDQLNGQFPISKQSGFVVNYRSLGTGCQGFISNEIYQQGDTLNHRANFDYSEIASVGEIYHNAYAEPEIFQFSIQLAPDETGGSRVKITASRDGYDTSPRDSIELGLLTRESADEVRGTLLELRSLCRARKRKEQASAGSGSYPLGRRDPDLLFAADRPHLAQGKAHARDLA